MKLHELAPAEGSRKVRNRVGRGLGSGNGKTAGRGRQGAHSRAGGGVGTPAEDHLYSEDVRHFPDGDAHPGSGG